MSCHRFNHHVIAPLKWTSTMVPPKGNAGRRSLSCPAAQRVSEKHSIMRVRINEGRTMAVEEGAPAECAICGNGFMHPVIFASRRQFGTRSTRATKAQCL